MRSTWEWKIGDRAKCITDSDGAKWNCLETGAVYTITGVSGDLLYVDGRSLGAFAYRFKPVIRVRALSRPSYPVGVFA